MVTQDELTVTDSGQGYVIGERKSRHPKLNYLNSSTLTTLFDGVDIALDFVANKMPKPQRQGSSTDTGRGDFNAFDTYDEAMETFRTHPEKVVKFDPAELRIKDESEVGSRVDYDVVGDYIDMGRYMEGIPESMGTMHSGFARNRRVSIVINLSQSWNIHHSVVTHRGERILRLVDALEAGGIRTQLTGISSNECGHVEVVLKHHDEPLTITDLAVVTHPEFLRRIIFRIKEYSQTWDYGYGSSICFSRALTPELVDQPNNEEMDIIVDTNFYDVGSVNTAFDKLERLLVWEMSKPVPEVSSIKVDANGIWFNPNGSRSDADIRREGQEAINAEA